MFGRPVQQPFLKSEYRRILGRIYVPKDYTSGHFPFLEIKGGVRCVPLKEIVDIVAAAYPQESDYELVRRTNIQGLRPDDVQSVRGYIHRFGTDVMHPFPVEHHKSRVLLLDENIPQSAMVSLSAVFGWATHVAAEKLAGRNTPDHNILAFGCQHRFSFLVTRDSDFLSIYRDLDAPAPVLIFIPENTDDVRLSRMFSQYSQGFHRCHERTKIAYCLSATEGLKPLF